MLLLLEEIGRWTGPGQDIMTASPMDLEDLLLSTLDAVSRFRVGQREAVGAALDAGDLLTTAKARLPHGGWAEWLDRLGLRPGQHQRGCAWPPWA